MKKLILFLGAFFLISPVKAVVMSNDVPMSSYSAVDSGGIVMFTSAAIQFIAVNVSSPSLVGGFVTIYRSTNPLFTLDIVTQTSVNTYFGGPVSQQPVSIPLYNMTNSSYTFIQKSGIGQTTLFYRCPTVGSHGGLCPGISGTGQK